VLREAGGRRLYALSQVLRESRLALYAAIAAVYALFRVGSFTNIPDRLTDTPTYESVAHLAPWNWRFYAGERGFTIPLFFKIVQSSESRIVVQLAFSTVAWIVFAAVVARCIQTSWFRPVVFAVILALSLTTEVILWDTLLLSESMTFALLALLLAAWITLVRSPRPRWAAAVLVLSLLWVFARDTNAYVLLVVGVLVGGTRVIVAGGLVEKYDPATVQSTGYTFVLLDSVDVFDTARGSWSSAPPMAVARWLATGSMLADGRFLVCGGGNPLIAGNDAVEAYTA